MSYFFNSIHQDNYNFCKNCNSDNIYFRNFFSYGYQTSIYFECENKHKFFINVLMDAKEAEEYTNKKFKNKKM